MKDFCIITTEGFVLSVKADNMNEAIKEAIERGYRVSSITAL